MPVWIPHVQHSFEGPLKRVLEVCLKKVEPSSTNTVSSHYLWIDPTIKERPQLYDPTNKRDPQLYVSKAQQITALGYEFKSLYHFTVATQKNHTFVQMTRRLADSKFKTLLQLAGDPEKKLCSRFFTSDCCSWASPSLISPLSTLSVHANKKRWWIALYMQDPDKWKERFSELQK